jgi:cell division protein FtsL
VKKLSKIMKLRHTLVLVALLGFSGGCAVSQVAKDSYYSVKHNVRETITWIKEIQRGIDAFEQELKKNPQSAKLIISGASPVG